MKKMALAILILSCFSLNLVHAVTIIHQDGNVTRTEPSSNTKKYTPSYSNAYKTSSRLDYYDEWGTSTGYSQKESFSGRTNHYNEWGTSQGYSERDKFTGEVKQYNEWGQLQGTIKPRR